MRSEQGSGWMRRALAFAAPCVVAALAAVVVVGLAEGVVDTYAPVQGLAAAGFVVLVGTLPAIGVALVARLLWAAWQPGLLAEQAREEGGGAPILAGWIIYALLALWAVTAATFNVVRLLSMKTQAIHVVALASALIITAVVAVLVIASRPVARAIAALARRGDRLVRARLGRSLLTPRIVVVAGVLAVCGWALIGWLVSIEPRIGHFDIGFAWYLAAGLLAGLAVQLAWPALRRRRWMTAGVAATTAVLAVASLASAYHVRHNAPRAFLEIWGETRLAADTIDLIYDIQTLRSELRMDEFRPVARPGAKHPDVVLITVDTVRADRTPLYGGRPIMPALSELGKDSAVFEWAFSPGNVTRRSLPTIALGLSPHRVRGRVAGWALRLDPRHVLLAERFRAAGYDTAGFFCCGSHFWPRHKLGLIRGIDHLTVEKDGAELTRMAVQWLAQREKSGTDKPLFLWLHYIEPHLWDKDYPAAEHGSDRKRRYDKSLIEVDTFLTRLLDAVWKPARRDDTIIAFTSDHGEGLGDHGFPYHSTTLYNAQIRVPLVIAAPGVRRQRVARPVGLVHVAPTLLDLAGFEPPGMPDMDGVSLAPLLRGEVTATLEDGEAYAVMVEDRSVPRDSWAIVVGRHKLIEHEGKREIELYDIVRDPHERKNLAEDEPALARRLRARLDAYRELDRVPPF